MSAKKKAAGASKRAKAAKKPKKRAVAAKGKASAKKSTASSAKKTSAKKSTARKLVGKGGAKKSAAKKPVAKQAAPKKPVAKKAPPKKLAAKKPVAKRATPKPEIKRRDGSGHLDPAYEADLRARIESKPKDDDRAFDGEALGNELGEEFVETVTSGEDEGAEIRDQNVTEELGGPFTVTTGGTEFAGDVDESNPEEATREPFPRT
jgi:hypothetical protein